MKRKAYNIAKDKYFYKKLLLRLYIAILLYAICLMVIEIAININFKIIYYNN